MQMRITELCKTRHFTLSWIERRLKIIQRNTLFGVQKTLTQLVTFSKCCGVTGRTSDPCHPGLLPGLPPSLEPLLAAAAAPPLVTVINIPGSQTCVSQCDIMKLNCTSRLDWLLVRSCCHCRGLTGPGLISPLFDWIRISWTWVDWTRVSWTNRVYYS